MSREFISAMSPRTHIQHIPRQRDSHQSQTIIAKSYQLDNCRIWDGLSEG